MQPIVKKISIHRIVVDNIFKTTVWFDNGDVVGYLDSTLVEAIETATKLEEHYEHGSIYFDI